MRLLIDLSCASEIAKLNAQLQNTTEILVVNQIYICVAEHNAACLLFSA